ncbi:MAG: TonB-dependent receptor [Lentisphaeraceae bacterium]|nr:TonB-dependent receptor [Lentisphaeraceae bacterium]
MQQSGLRLDWSINDGESLTLQGDFFKSTFGNLGVSGSDNRERSGENVVLSYNKNHDDGSNTSAKVFYNMYENIEGGTFLGFSEDVETVDFDIQHRWTTGSHEITVGGGYRTTSAAYDELYTPPGLGSLPALVLDDGVYKFSNLYVQDKITVVEDRFYLTAGLKAEYNNFTDFEAMPSLRAVYSPDEKQTFWASVSRAVRTPSFFENDSDILFGISEPPTYTFKGNDKAQSENLTAYELGYRVKPAENIILDFTAFYYDYEDIISYEIAFAPPFNSGIVKNDAKAEVYGAELAAKWIASEDLIIQMAYSYASMKLEVPGSSSEINYGFGNTLTPGSQGVLASDDNLPKHMANLRASYSLTEKLILSGAVYYMAENENNEISSWTRVDVGLIYQAMDNLEISIHAANLTDNYREESNDQFANDAQQTRRSVFVNASYSF